MTQNEALKLALEAADELEWMLKSGYEHGREGPPRVHRLIAKIRTLSAQQSNEQVEPVAMRHSFNGHGYKYTDIGFGNGWVDWTKHNFKDVEPLYTTPPQRKPLTDEQRLIEMVDAAMVATRDIVPRITRSQCRLIIEAAHGIKE